MTFSDTPERSSSGVMPPFQNENPAPRIIAQVDVLRPRDDALVEHQPDLLGQGGEDPLAHLVLGQHDRLGRDLQQRRAPRGRRPACPRARRRTPSCRPRRPGAGSPRRRTGPGRPRAASRRRAARPPGRPGRAARTATSAGRAPPSARSATSSGVPSSTTPVTSPRQRVSSRLTTNAGASLHQHAGLLQRPADGERRGQRRVVGPLAADDLQQRQHRDRVEEVEARRPARGAPAPAAISVTDSDEVLVASTHSAETTASTSAKTCCLTASSSKTASMTKSASAKPSLVERAGDQRLEPVGPVRADPALAPAACRSRRGRSRRPCRRRSWSRSVSTTGTSSRRANSSASWLAIRPAPTTPTLVTGRASALSGAPAGRLARFCTRSKA